MKPQKDTLFILTRSLSKDERRSFKKALTIYNLEGRTNLFLVLFSVLENMAVYSYEALLNLTKDKISGASLSSVKSQLKRKLIAFLREKDASHYKLWHEMLEDAQLLSNRGIFAEAHSLLQKVKKEAVLANRMYYVIAALRIEGRLLQHLNQNDLFSATRALGTQILNTSKDLLRTAEIYDFYTNILSVTFKGNIAVRYFAILAQLRQLHAGKIYNMDPKDLSTDQLIFLWIGKYTLARLLGRTNEIYALAEQKLELLKANMNYFRLYQPANIVPAYIDFIETCTILNLEKPWATALNEFKVFIDEAYPGVNFYSAYYVYLKYSFVINNDGSPGKLAEAVKHLEAFYESHKQIPVLNVKMLEISLLWGYYKLRKYDTSLDYARHFNQENISEETADEMHDFVRIIILAIRFEYLLVNGFKENEIETFNSFVTSDYHHFRKIKNGDYRLELAMLFLFRQVGKVKDKISLKPYLVELHAKLKQWLDSDVPYVQTFNLGFKITDWVKAQMLLININSAP